MINIIYKQDISNTTQEFLLPKESIILDFQFQNNSFVFWYQCNPDYDKVKYMFRIKMTGVNSVNRYEHYVSTIQVTNLVYHLYYEIL